MRRLWCRIVGHDLIPVREVGRAARPGGILPSIDGYVTYEADADGDFQACRRCREVCDEQT